MTGLEEEEQMITVTVSPRIYTREEADAVFYEVMEGMEERTAERMRAFRRYRRI